MYLIESVTGQRDGMGRHTLTHLLTSCIIMWHTVKYHTPTPWKLISFWIRQFNVIPGWGTKNTSLHESLSHFRDHIPSYWRVWAA